MYVLSLYVPFFLIGCAGSVGISLASRVIYIFRVCVSAVWSAGPIQVNLGHSAGAGGGTVQIFLFLWRCSSRYGTVEKVKGVVRFSYFLQFAVSFLGGWMSAVGIFVLYILIFLGRFVVLSRGFLFCKLLIFNNLLQVVP